MFTPMCAASTRSSSLPRPITRRPRDADAALFAAQERALCGAGLRCFVELPGAGTLASQAMLLWKRMHA